MLFSDSVLVESEKRAETTCSWPAFFRGAWRNSSTHGRGFPSLAQGSSSGASLLNLGSKKHLKPRAKMSQDETHYIDPANSTSWNPSISSAYPSRWTNWTFRGSRGSRGSLRFTRAPSGRHDEFHDEFWSFFEGFDLCYPQCEAPVR